MPTQIVDFRRIWDRAPHNALTDLIRFREEWLCVCREGDAHASPGGVVRILASENGVSWNSAATLSDPKADLRDPKLSITPDGRLMLNAAAAWHQPAPNRHQSLVWFSPDGREWVGPKPIGDPDVWLWRVTWHKGIAYSAGYSTVDQTGVRLYSSFDGLRYKLIVPALHDQGDPNEATMLFQPGGSALLLLRREAGEATAQLGSADAPYREWTWRDLGVRIGGPHAIRLPDGRMIAAARRYGGAWRTSLHWLDPNAGRLEEFLTLPSGGDTSYAGLVWHEGLLWVSYYSSHEEKTCVYIARVELS